jgi:multidrug resistance efflux pump
MEAILLGIYSLVVWLVFIKFKLLPWTTPWKVGVVIFPVVVMAAMLLALNIFAPTTTDVRVVKYVVPIVSQVRGRVIEVPVNNNQPVKKGDVLFRIDPTPYVADVRALEAQLLAEEAKIGAERARLGESQTHLPDAESGERQLREQLNRATSQIASLQASLELARRRVTQNTELAATGAGNRFDLEQAQTNASELMAQIAAARAAEQEVKEKLSGRIRGDLASVAGAKAQISTAQAQIRVAQAQADTTRAQLDNARWNLDQTTVVAPSNGTMVNVMLRPGYFVAGMPFNEVMTFVDTHPGRVIKAHVDSVIWAQAQGQIDASGNLPVTGFTPPPGKFPVKLVVAERDHSVFLAAGARGAAAIYTDHLSLIHIIRKVLIRTSSYLDYLIIKHHISLH